MPMRLQQLIDNHHAALGRLRAALATPQSAGQAMPTIFGRNISDDEYGLALAESLAHCHYLWHAGEATRARRSDGAWMWHVAA